MKRFVVSAAVPIAAALVAAGHATPVSAAPAPTAFTVCTACHKVSADDAISVGPNLRGVVGRKAGSQSNYSYSAALKASGIAWTPDKLDQWLSGPSKMIPGTRMVQSTPNSADRKNIVEYLSTMK